MIGIDDVRAAASRLERVAHRTPVITSRTIDDLVGAQVFLKAENLQRIGAFKFRGAYNAIASLSPEERGRGVFTFSSGNHAQAVALSCRLLDTRAVILMPHDAPALKVAATRGYGAEVVTYDRYADSREELGGRLADERGMVLVRPYDDERVMAGQGTAALELVTDAGDLDVFLAPVGGGGLLAGCSTVMAALRPSAAVWGVEPAAREAGRRAYAEGTTVTLPIARTIADGQQTPSLGEHTLPVIRERTRGILAVTDDEIVAAMRLLFERCKLVVEPSGAAALAALLAGHVPDTRARRIGVILSGGNIGADRFGQLLGSTPDTPTA